MRCASPSAVSACADRTSASSAARGPHRRIPGSWAMRRSARSTVVGPGVDPAAHRPDGRRRAERRLPHLRPVPPRVDFGLCGTAVRRDEPSGGARRAARRPGAIRLADSRRFADRPRLRRADGGRESRAATYRFTPPRVGPRGRSRCPGPADVSCPPRSRRRRPCSRREPGARRTRDSAGRHRRVGDDEQRFDLVVDTVGSPRTADAALGNLEVGGTLLLLGLDNHPLEVTAQTIVRRQAVVRGSLTYDHPADFEAAIRIVADERFGPGRIVSDEYPLADAQAAFDHSPSAAGKTWIRIAVKS